MLACMYLKVIQVYNKTPRYALNQASTTAHLLYDVETSASSQTRKSPQNEQQTRHPRLVVSQKNNGLGCEVHNHHHRLFVTLHDWNASISDRHFRHLKAAEPSLHMLYKPPVTLNILLIRLYLVFIIFKLICKIVSVWLSTLKQRSTTSKSLTELRHSTQNHRRHTCINTNRHNTKT